MDRAFGAANKLGLSSYVPVKVDYSDVFDLMAFFSGDMDRDNSNDDLARRIALNAMDFVERFWRYEDMEAYSFRLHLEWARLLGKRPSSLLSGFDSD